MPNLPTLTLSQAQYDLVLASFPGKTDAVKEENYNHWLTNRVIERVKDVESTKAMQAVESYLPPLAPEPSSRF